MDLGCGDGGTTAADDQDLIDWVGLQCLGGGGDEVPGVPLVYKAFGEAGTSNDEEGFGGGVGPEQLAGGGEGGFVEAVEEDGLRSGLECGV